MSYDLHDPADRARAIKALGVDGYNRAMEEHRRKNVVATVNGYDIRRVVSDRFGTIFMIDGANVGYQDQARAEAVAAKLAPRNPA